MSERQVEQERKLTAVNAGRVAQIAWNVIEPLLAQQKSAALSELTGGLRGGKSPNELYPMTAKLAAIEDLENSIRAQVVRGERAAKGLFDA